MEPLFENAHLVVVDKPSGWLSVPSRIGKADSRPCVQIHLSETRKQQIWPVHRLDEEVSGVLLMAKTAECHQVLSGLFENQGVGKEYEAITSAGMKAPPLGKEFRWVSKLLRGKKRAYEKPFGKNAVTLAKCEQEISPAYLFWKLFPLTGRSHQLRYELAKQGFPIVGDVLYGGSFSTDEGIALRAVGVTFKEAEAIAPFSLPGEFRASGLVVKRFI